MAETLIEWTNRRHPRTGAPLQGFTFNPWIGCQRCSEACKLCYAITLDDKRFSKTLGGATPENPIPHFGPSAPRHRTSPDNWKNPLAWNRKALKAGAAMAVFCASLADVFDENPLVPESWRDDLFELIVKTPALDWLLLTKRPHMAKAYLARNGCPPNVWLGATMENQHWFDHRMAILQTIGGPAVIFASMEPLLGPVDVHAGFPELTPLLELEHLNCCCPEYAVRNNLGVYRGTRILPRRLDWVIAGGESHDLDRTQSRPTHPDDVLGIASTCWATETPFFWKQWGDWAPAYELDHNPQAQAMCVMGNVRKFDHGRGAAGRRLAFNVGKAAAGATFEGQEWRQMPPVRLVA